MRTIGSLTDEEIVELSGRSDTLAGILKNAGIRLHGTTYQTLVSRLRSLGLYQTMREKSLLTAAKRNGRLKISEDDFFVLGVARCGSSTKKRMFARGIPRKCCLCGQGEEWQGKKLCLQVDHINGIHTDNRIENLRIVCPNCHSQTETYSGSKLKKPRRMCVKCNRVLSRHTKGNFCRLCSPHRNTNEGCFAKKVPMATLNQLKDDLLNNIPISAIGKKYGVRDTTVRKWIKYYGTSYQEITGKPDAVRRKQSNFCLDCGARIKRTSTRCSACSMRYRKANNLFFGIGK